MNAPPKLELAPPDGRLDSWKEIAAYLGRNERTVRRWEQQEGLPVHRLMHDKKGSVYAYRTELDAWRVSRKPSFDDKEESSGLLETAASERPSRRRRFVWLAGAAALCAAGLGVWMTTRPRVEHPSLSSIAVLPFDNLSHNQAEDWFSDGMTEALITELSKVRSLKVISRTSVMQYKSGKKPLKQIGRELGVDAVVEGSALRVGDRVRITAQLIAASTDTHLWGRDFDRDVRDLLDLQKEVAGIIAHQVGATLGTAKARAVKPEAMAAYLKGLYQFNRADDAQAILLAREAIVLEPQMAQSHELLGKALLIHADFGNEPYGVIMPEARAEFQRALELEPERPVALSWLGWSYFTLEHDWVRAEKNMRAAFQLDPSTGNNYASLLACLGQYDRAIQAVDQALEHDPANPLLVTDAGRIYLFARRYEDAIRLFRKGLDLDPTSIFPRAQLFYALVGTQREKEALDFVLKFSEERHIPASEAYRSGGWPALWRVLVDHYRNKNNKLTILALMRLGRNQDAIAILEAFEREHESAAMLELESPFYDPLRQEPRFRAIMHRVGYPESMWR